MFDRVIESVDGLPIDIGEAKEIRLESIEERKAFVEEENKHMAQES